MNVAGSSERPPHALLYSGFLLNGMAVVLLGPLLPRLAHAWLLADVPQGAFLAAQFLGSSAGTILVMRTRRRAMVAGPLCSWAGLSALGLLLRFSAGTRAAEALACASLALYGFGLGQVVTALNLAAGKGQDGRSARLSFGNAMWSIGAIVSPILAGLSEARISTAAFLLVFAAVFIAFASAAAVFSPRLPVAEAQGQGADGQASSMGHPAILYFTVLLLLYGGAETCFSGWLTSLAERAVHARDTAAALGTSAFWFGIAAGRLVAGAALRRFPDRAPTPVLVGGSLACSGGLLWAHSPLLMATFAAAIGALLGPVFPVLLGDLMARGASARQCGTALAACGAGASLFPLLLSLVSQRTGSLRMAFLLPGLCLLVMFVLSSSLPMRHEKVEE